MGHYDNAQICLNGHIITSFLETEPDRGQTHCENCSAATINACQSCNIPIRGHYHVKRPLISGILHAPAFCHKCGTPYPWTSSKLEAARELVDDLGLDVPEKTLLTESIEELVKDTPKAQAAAVRFQQLTEKAKPVVMEAFRQVLYNVLSEPVRKMIWP